MIRRVLSKPKKSSIMQDQKRCWFCGKEQNLHLHHIYFGTGKRQISDENGFTVWLCQEHHEGRISPHMNRNFDLDLKMECQRLYEENHTREEFIKLVGRNYL